MSVEDYFYSSLEDQEIEDTLLGAISFNKIQELTTTQKARARENIGAGEASTSFKILGFFATLDDLKNWLQTFPEPGDAYGISRTPTAMSEYLSPDGTHSSYTISEQPWYIKITEVGTGTVLVEGTDFSYFTGTIIFTVTPPAGENSYLVEWSDEAAPYNVYTWDGIQEKWVDNGSLLSSDIIDDNDILSDKTWSSSKIDSELDAKQDTLTAGDISTSLIADGAVTRQKLAADALYSPLKNKSSNYSITEDDIGYTIFVTNFNVTITLSAAVISAIPVGAEIGIMGSKFTGLNLQVTVPSDAGRINIDGKGMSFTTVKIDSGYSMCVIKKTSSANVAFFGNAEVVT